MAAAHNDAWLMSLATYYCVAYEFERKERKKLLNKIANLPTISDVLMSSDQTKDGNSSSSKSVSETEDEDIYFCAKCNKEYVKGEFCISCDTCFEWFHGVCVKMDAEKAEKVAEYKCPSCNRKDPSKSKLKK